MRWVAAPSSFFLCQGPVREGIGVILFQKIPSRHWVLILLPLASLASPLTSSGHHEVDKAKQEAEAAVRATFEAFNRKDLNGFLAGWTDRGFMEKKVFRFLFRTTFAKDEAPVFLGDNVPRPYFRVEKIANVVVRGDMLSDVTLELELLEGPMKDRHLLRVVKRPYLDDRWKIDQSAPLPPVIPEDFRVVEVKMTEYGFEFDKSRAARDMALRLVNAGKEAHEFVVFRRLPSEIEESVVRGAWALAPGERTTLVLAGLGPGSYVMVCCRADPGGKPHCSEGMRAEFTIP